MLTTVSKTDEWLSLPVQADRREHPMFDLVPFAGSGRIMAHDNFQPGFVGELLQVKFPGAVPLTLRSVVFWGYLGALFLLGDWS
jgi:hypothetical protein